MSAVKSDALVFFGATGDLAFKQIFPALQSMIHHGDARHTHHRRGKGRMEPRSTEATSPRESRAAWWHRPGRVHQTPLATAVRRRGLQ